MRRLLRPSLAVAVALAALTATLPAQALPLSSSGSGRGLPSLQQPKPVPVKRAASGGSRRPDAAGENSWKPPGVKWPAAGKAEVALNSGIVNSGELDSLTGLRGAPRSWPQQGTMKQAGTLPVAVAPAGTTPSGAASGPTKVQVTVADREAARRAGVEGMLLSVGRTDDGVGAKRAKVRVDYSSFRAAYGGDWASRLRLVQLPACAVTTPEKTECRLKNPLPTANDTTLGNLSAEVELPALQAGRGLRNGTSSGPAVLAATADAQGSTGDYKASPLEASGSWSAGGSTGAFNWSYPIHVPAVPGGLQPSVALNYSSQTVDGRTAASNNQPGWIGDGWSWEPGFIERRFKACNKDKDGTNKSKTGDLCWYNDNAILSLGGKTTELVQDKDKGWHPASDAGEKVEKLTGANNGDNNGEHWKITTTDGVQYFFGLNRLPGWKDASTPETHSAWTVPVFGNHVGEPCYGSSFAGSWCQQAWRWQLDYVVDPHGNAMAYFWKTESNNYGRNVDVMTGKATSTPYIRGGWLDHIDYGLRSDSVYAAKAMAQVQFGVDERCLQNCGAFDEDHAKYWPDAPFDQYCKDGVECKDKYSPTFWSRKRLTNISTRVLTGGSYKDVDSWALEQDFPASGDGVSTPMWLKSVTRTGKAGGSQSLPPVRFAGVQRANRVDKLGDGLAPFVRLRLYQITTEAGGTVAVDYSEPDCTATGLPPADGTNSTRCYPVRWAYEGESAKQDWFNSYVVTRVLEGDNLAETPDTVTEYAYLDGAAWTKSTDEFTDAQDRTYSVPRGYGRVQTRTGTTQDGKTLAETRYFRGIEGKEVKDSAGVAVADHEQFAGVVRERATYIGDGGPLVSATSYTPWRSTATASRTRSGLPDLQAYLTGTKEEQTRTTTSRGERRTAVSRSFDGYGMVTEVSDLGDLSKSGDEQCTTTTYVRSMSSWLLSKVARTETVAVPCGAAVTRPGDVTSDTRTYYDGAGDLTAAPVRGDVSRTEQINGQGNGYDTLVSTPSTCGASKDKLCYDIYGRQLAASDAYGKTTVTEYSPATGEAAAKTTVTNPLGHQATTVLDPLRDQPIQVTDANARVTTTAYDPLGRVSKVWTPARPATANADTPSHAFDYLIRNDAPNIVTTRSLNLNNVYQTSYAFYDGLLRARQTQVPSPDDAGRLVTETFYNSRGQAWRSSGTYYADGKAEPVLVTGEETKYPSSVDTEFDGAGRPTAVIARKFGDETKRSTTSYTGDTTTVVPPRGGVATTTVTDARGRTVELKQYTDADRQASQSTTYDYDKNGRLAKVADPSGAQWKYTYDVRGRKIHAEDPDKGASDTTYDSGDRVTDVKDARGVALHTEYDMLGRRTALTQGGTKLAEWSYDSAAGGKGQLASATRYADGAAYTSRITAYSSLYKPATVEVTVPGKEGALAGTYTWTTAYYHTGQVKWARQPAVGDLLQEDLTPGYTYNSGKQVSLSAGTDPLVSATSYDHYGRVVREEFGEFGKHLYGTYEYDEHTNALTKASSDRDATPGRVEDTRYTYDPAGNVTSIATAYGQDEQRTADTQCFTTDALRRITEAWTTPDKCGAGPSPATVGGPDAYWATYTYDAVGNRKSEVQHKTASGPPADITRTYQAPGAGKHLLTQVTEAAPAGASAETYAYDEAGNTRVRKIGGAAPQTLDWDPEGHLSKVTQGDTVDSYIYDAEGQRLLRKDSSGTTLYLPGGTELRMKDGAVSGTRYYTNGAKTIAVRTGGRLTFLVSDEHNTTSAQIDTATQAITRRKTTIFGAPRGPQPGSWAGDKRFVGGTEDHDTGLTHLGAREYDPAIGRFVSVDPVMDLSDPQQTHGYTYANNNPATFSDASGLRPEGPAGGKPSNDEEYYRQHGQTGSGWFLDDYGGWSYRHEQLYPSPTGSDTNARTVSYSWGRAARSHGMTAKSHSSIVSWRDVPSKKQRVVGAFLGEITFVAPLADCANGSKMRCFDVVLGLNPYVKGAQAARGIKAAARARQCNSFLPDTEVLMADGKRKKIKDVKVGDKVLAADPASGGNASKPVTKEILGNGRKNLVEISLSGAGDLFGGGKSVTATEGHPFWLPERRQWVEAKALLPHDWIQTSSGSWVQVSAVKRWTQNAAVNNLTVADLHTYYVLAGATPVLVHNCNPSVDDVFARAAELGDSSGEYLYRGVTNNHYKLAEARAGIAEPRGGHSDPVAHSGDNTESVFTSWSPDLETAREFSEEFGSSGALVLRIPRSAIDPSRMRVAGQRGLEELEVLIEGRVTGCQVSCEWGPFR
ncbi:polymorphic toxin-type HINT domain-containing protein [Streptomyces sp. NPDC049585]|uniref:polymorphic toxin-type HINT domain-containing protein n=1 Tax=Streptomyces sp. NPDC049585 TaxID=3155154 RepID=UPI003422D8FE